MDRPGMSIDDECTMQRIKDQPLPAMRNYSSKNTPEHVDGLYLSGITGGAEGGDCWGGEAQSYVPNKESCQSCRGGVCQVD
jgi:hypothetical protein